MSDYDEDLTSSRAYQQNVAKPDAEAWAKEAAARAVPIERAISTYRCVHYGMRERPYSIAVALEFSLDTVLVDLCAACNRKLKPKAGK